MDISDSKWKEPVLVKENAHVYAIAGAWLMNTTIERDQDQDQVLAMALENVLAKVQDLMETVLVNALEMDHMETVEVVEVVEVAAMALAMELAMAAEVAAAAAEVAVVAAVAANVQMVHAIALSLLQKNAQEKVMEHNVNVDADAKIKIKVETVVININI
jgi:hypothetical protein